MAPSSLKGVPSMGIFTTRDIEEGEAILAAPDGPTITLLTESFRAHTPKFPQDNWIHMWGNYAWGRRRGVPDHVSYEAKSMMDFQITTGALPNHHCLLHAIAFRFPDPAYDDSLVDHRTSPGTGAFSYNRGRDFYVKRKVQAGEELFLNYGHCRHDNHPAWAEGLPMPVDYRAAVDFMIEMHRNTSDYRDDAESYKLEPPPDLDPLVVKVLPSTLQQLRDIMAGNHTVSEMMRQLSRRSGINQRTPQWLRENGKCLEHMVPGLSQLPHAGHGGIAQHSIAKGDVVVPAPMVHVMDRDVMALYDENGLKVGDQLLLNYCFGHRESSLLLCPNTNAILINHCSKQSKQDCIPNAEVRWSTGGYATSDAWRDMSLVELSRQPYRGLEMDIVAVRDIAPGEEVFMDYGPAWENAWKNHVATWEPFEPMFSAKEANDQDYPPDFLISGDLRKTTYHPHLFAGCQYWTTENDEHTVWDKKDPDWRDRTDRELLEKYADDGSDYVGDYSHHHDLSYWPCVLFRPEENNGLSSAYTVRILQNPFTKKQTWASNQLPRFLTNYPHKSIHFFVRKEETDQSLPGVFRHYIGMPDDVFPQHWKNLNL
jgi:hypothetical protein